jgi:hypothetical protein
MFQDRVRDEGVGKQLRQKSNLILNPNSLSVLALIASYGFICLAVMRMLVPINSSADNTYFMPLSFMYLEKGELANPWLNPIGSSTFNWHGFIHPLAVAAVAVGKGWYGVNSGIVVLGLATFSLFIILVYASGTYLKFIIPATLIVVSMIISYSGRPDTTVAILCMLLYSTNRGTLRFADSLFHKGTWILSGVLIGAIGAAAPKPLPIVVLAQTCFILAIYGVRDNNVKRLCISLPVIFGTALVTLLLLLIFVYPFPAVEWIYGIVEHSRINFLGVGINAPRTEAQDFVKQLLLSKDAPLIVLYSWFVIPIALALYKLTSTGANKALGYLTLSAFALTAILLLRGLMFAFGRYDFTVFVPTILLIVGSLLMTDRYALHKSVTFSLLYVLATFALLTQFVWIYQSTRSSRTAHLYNSRLAEILLNAIDAGLKVGVNGSILTAVDNADQLRKVRVIRNDDEADATKFDLVILSQNEHPSGRPIPLKNFEIIEVNYDPCCSLLFPRPLNNAFTAYRSLDRTR